MGQLTADDFSAYPSDVTDQDAVVAGPNALYYVPVDDIAPTQMDEGLSEVGKKSAGFDLETPVELQSDLLTDIEPVVIGPDGQLYLLDGHHTFTALLDSVYGASDPNVYVDVVANYSSLSVSQFFTTLQQNNLLLPLNDGVPQTVNDATGAPIPTSLTDLTSDPYRGLEYSILKNKSSKLFTTASNITGAVGASTPGLDKMTGFYSDFLEAAAYRDADGGLGLPYLSPGDIALATKWNLTATSPTTLPNVTGTVEAGQLPGFILSGNIAITGVISNATLANGALDGTATGTFDESTTFASFNGVTEINAGTAQNPIIIGTPNTGFILQLGADKGFAVTLSNTNNTYTGGTSLLAGTLIIAGDGSLGAAPGAYSYNQTTVKTDVQAANGIVFNGLTEGNPTLQVGTSSGGGTATFSTSRPIAVGGEVATLNVNGYIVTLNGPLVSLGVDGDGIGNATGFSDFTVDDNSSNKGVLILSTASPNFYGNLIVGNSNAPTVRVMSDAALGNTTGPSDEIGEVELNGGTLQTGASFTATERNLFLASGSNFDVDGNTTSWGTMTDVQRTLDILNSNTASAGAVTFNNLTISATSILQLAGGPAGETVTFTNGIVRTGNDTLVIQPSGTSSLGNTEKVFSGTGAASLVDTIAPVWIVENNDVSGGAGPYDFVTYGANGYVKASYDSTATLSGSTGADVVALSGSATLSGSASVYALNTEGKTIALGTNTLTIGDGTDAAGLILASGSSITGGTLAFGASEGVIWLSGSNPTISSQITGSGGLDFSGSGTVGISTAASVSGAITIDSGTVVLSAANVFQSDAAGVELADVKSKPSAAKLTISANNQLAGLNSVGNNSTVTINSGAALTIGDTTNNLSSTLSSTITESGAATAGALTFDGSGLFDLSGGKITLIAGSSIIVNNSAQLRVAASEFNASTYGIVLNGTSQLQFAQSGGGQFANAVSGTGELHLIGGTLQLTGTSNSYSGGTIVETGSTLDITTANLPTVNENITDAGGLIVFDMNNTQSGAYTGTISDGQEMGTGPMLSGSLDKDDSTNDNASTSNLTLSAVQAYSGATYVEAGTLTLGVANAIADSSGVTLGRVGGAVDSQTAGLALNANEQLTSLSDNASNTTSVVLNGNTLTLAPTLTSVSTYGGSIVDGSSSGSVVIDGAGTATLSGDNAFSGGVTLDEGTLVLGNAQAVGTGTIDFAGTDATLKIDFGDAPANAGNIVNGFAVGDAIDFAGIGLATNFSYSGGVLQLTGGSSDAQIDIAAPPAHDDFSLASDNNGGTVVTLATVAAPSITTLVGQPTNGSTVELQGTGQNGDTVTLYADGGNTAVGSGTVSGGTFDIVTTADFANGDHTFTATQTDTHGVTSVASTSFPIAVAPTVTVTTTNDDVNLADNSATIDFAFSEAPVDFSLANVTATGGTLSGFAGSGTSYTATFTGAADTDISNASVNVDDNWHDSSDIAGASGSTTGFVVDTVTPTVTVTTDNDDVNIADDAATITFSFSEAPTSFTLADTSAVGGTLSNLQQVNTTTYTATFTAAAATLTSTASVRVAAGSWQENNGNTGSGGSTGGFVVDTVTPTMTVSTSNSDVNLDHDTAKITFAFSAAPASFTLADTSAVGGTLSNLVQVNATHYTALFAGTAATDIGDASVSVTTGSWQDANGNPGGGASTGSFTVDTVKPTVTVTTDNDDVNIADDTATITFTFSEAPVSFTLADTAAVCGTLSNLQAVNAATYTATFTGAAATDTSHASVRVKGGSWKENSGNSGSGGSTGSFVVDTVTPTVTVTTNHSDVNLTAHTANIVFVFSAAPQSFTLADTSAVGGTLSNLIEVNGTRYHATFTPDAAADISDASVSVTTGSWQDTNGNPGGGGSTGSFVVDTVKPTVTVTTDNDDVNIADNTATITFAFSEAPVSFTVADTAAVDGTLSNLQEVNATEYTATFTAAAAADTSHASVRVKGGSWKENNGNSGSGGSTGSFVVDTVTPTVTVTTNNSDVTLAHDTANIAFAFSEAPVTFDLADTSAVGGTLSDLTKINATHYTATFTGAADTDINSAAVSVTASSWQEVNGNPGNGGSTGSFTVDTAPPSGTVADDGLHTANIALLSQYAASMFLTASDSHSGMPIPDPSSNAAAALLTQPHH